MSQKILFVDDELNVLLAFERQFRKRFDMQIAPGPERGLQAISDKGPFAVVVSDLRMPGMDGATFLSRVKQHSPDTVRILLTGQADLNAAIAAVNQGSVFQFLTKPCPPDSLIKALEAGLEQYRLITSERDLIENTLKGSIAVMTEILSLVNPIAFSRAHRIRRYVNHMVEELNLKDRWQYELAAMLSQIGCVTVPSDLMGKVSAAVPLAAGEEEIFASHCKVGHDLLVRIPRLEVVAAMVERQRDPWNGDGRSDSEPATIGGNLLRIAADFDQEIARGGTAGAVLGMMQNRPEYNHVFVSALKRIEVGQVQVQTEARELAVTNLRQGMIIDRDILAKNGLVLVTKGHEVTESILSCLSNFKRTVGIAEPVRVVVPAALTL
jgi:response regulator RpfG family c-di-GMP phosphodiesterase